MIRADNHLEFAHIYADTEFGRDQLRSALIAKQILGESGGRTVSAVLVDDLHIDRNTLNLHSLASSIRAAGIKVDHIAFESRFDVVADQIIQAIPEEMLSLETFRKQKRQVLNLALGDTRIGLKTFEQGREVHSCALLSASWSLCRLGIFPFPQGSLLSFTDAPVIARRATSILHRSYDPVERKVREIIRVAGHAERLSDLRHVFHS